MSTNANTTNGTAASSQGGAAVADYDVTKDDGMQLLYTDKAGMPYYGWKDIKRLPPERYIAGLMQVEYANMGMTDKEALKYCDDALAAFNGGDYASAGYNIQSMRNRIYFADPVEAWRTLATVYTLIPGEPYISFAGTWGLRKKEMWRADEDAHAFFLSLAFTTGNHLLDTSKAGIPNVSLTNLYHVMNSLLAILQSKSANSSMTSTSITAS